MWRECRSNFYSSVETTTGQGRCRDGRDCGREYEFQRIQNCQYLPPQLGQGSLPPPPVLQILTSPPEAHYYSQDGGSQPLSVGPGYGSSKNNELNLQRQEA